MCFTKTGFVYRWNYFTFILFEQDIAIYAFVERKRVITYKIKLPRFV